jgi:2-keto-4-pentenoate hydratase/2-oxohepta-3-ene-1,7-dioic acid hydratase in catechol pathway
VRSHVRPRVALERDGHLYDVEALERALGAAVEVPGDPSDFHLRVVALGCAGLADLDAKLLSGRRPAAAHLAPEDVAPLPPCDPEHGTFVHVDTRALSTSGRVALRVGVARELRGQDAFVGMPPDETRPDFEVGIAALLGDDLTDATAAQARSAIVGYAVLNDWCARDAEANALGGLETVKSVRSQLGPYLLAATATPKLERLRVWVDVGGQRVELGTLAELGIDVHEAIARASHALPLAAGDVVGVGPMPRGSMTSLGLTLDLHEPVAVAIERIGTLRGTPVPRR